MVGLVVNGLAISGQGFVNGSRTAPVTSTFAAIHPIKGASNRRPNPRRTIMLKILGSLIHSCGRIVLLVGGISREIVGIGRLFSCF